MPKKLNPETPQEQSARFIRVARKLVDAGELDPIEADAAMDALVRKSIKEQGA